MVATSSAAAAWGCLHGCHNNDLKIKQYDMFSSIDYWNF
jgi:hypothetical protein